MQGNLQPAAVSIGATFAESVMFPEEVDAGQVARSSSSPAQGRLEGILGSFIGILLVVAIYMMVTKPGL